MSPVTLTARLAEHVRVTAGSAARARCPVTGTGVIWVSRCVARAQPFTRVVVPVAPLNAMRVIAKIHVTTTVQYLLLYCSCMKTACPAIQLMIQLYMW